MRQVLAVVGLVLLPGCWQTVRPPVIPTVLCEGDVAITSSADLDAFIARGCTSLSGTLGISGEDLTNVDLYELTSVGALWISGNPVLTTIHLPALEAVWQGTGCASYGSGPHGGFECWPSLMVWGNPSLGSLSLPALAIAGSLDITLNGALLDLDLPALASSGEGGCSMNYGTLSGSCFAGLRVKDNAALRSLGLASLGEAVTMEVSGNPLLQELRLPALAAIRAGSGCIPAISNGSCVSYLAVMDNAALAVVSAPVVSELAELVVRSNPGLTILDLPALTEDTGYLEVTDNLGLPPCQPLGLLTRLRGQGFAGQASITGNGESFNCSTNTTCQGGLVIHSSDDWSALAAAGCTEVAGGVSVETTTIQNLPANDVLQIVDGGVTVRGNPLLTGVALTALRSASIYLTENPALTSVEFPALATGAVQVTANASLTTLVLPEIRRTEFGLSIKGNGALATVSVPALESAGYWFEIWDNPALSTLEAPALATANSLSIDNNDALRTVSLGALASIEGCCLSIGGNATLESVDLHALATAGGLYVNSNTQLRSMDLSALRTLTSNQVGITDNPVYPQCAAQAILAQLIDFPWTFPISGNDTTATCSP